MVSSRVLACAGVAAAFILQIVLVIPPGSAAIETHTFECGNDVPPSGPYLDRATGILYEYSCLTGTLTPASSGVEEECHMGNAVTEPVPVAGTCALLKKDSLDSHSTRFKIAEIRPVGESTVLQWEVRDRTNGAILYNGTSNVIALGTIYFWERSVPKSLDCSALGGEITIGGRIQWPSGGRWSGTHNTVNQC